MLPTAKCINFYFRKKQHCINCMIQYSIKHTDEENVLLTLEHQILGKLINTISIHETQPLKIGHDMASVFSLRLFHLFCGCWWERVCSFSSKQGAKDHVPCRSASLAAAIESRTQTKHLSACVYIMCTSLVAWWFVLIKN